MRGHSPPPPGSPPPETAVGNRDSTQRSPASDADRPMETAFERLVGRQPSEAERARLYAVREALGLGSSDALWLVLIALQYYHSLYEQFPPLIRAAANEVLVEFKTETDTLLKSAAVDLEHTARQLQHPLMEAAHHAVQEAQAQFLSAIHQMAHRVARRARLGQFWPWLLGGGVLMALALVVVTGVALGYGRQQGYTAGYTEGYALGLQQAQASARIHPPSDSSLTQEH